MSFRDHLREQVKKKTPPLIAGMPDYDDELIVVFRIPDEDGQQAASTVMATDQKAGQIRTLIEACAGFYENPGGGKVTTEQDLANLAPVTGEDGTHARFDQHLAWYLGLEDCDTDVDIVRAAFKQNPGAINAMAGRVGVYIANPSNKTVEAVLGG